MKDRPKPLQHVEKMPEICCERPLVDLRTMVIKTMQCPDCGARYTLVKK